MMFQDMRAWVRRRLRDPNAVVFTAPEVDSAINQAAMLVQKRVMKTAPDAFRRIYTRNIVANVNRYAVPTGLLRTKTLMVDLYNSGTKEEAGVGVESWIINGFYNETGEEQPKFCITGGEIVLWPTPTVAVTDGMELHYCPCITLADDDDDPEFLFGLVQPLHMAIVLYAAKLLLPEEGEDVRGIDAELGEMLSDIGSYYAGQSADSSATPMVIRGVK